MFIYIALLVGCAAAGLVLCNEKFGKHGKMTYCILAAVVFILVSAFRFEVGYDYLLYGGVFSKMKYWDISDLAVHKMEKGFLFPLYILSLGFESYETVFGFTSLIYYPVVFYLIYKNSSKPWVSTTAFLVLGVFFNSLCFLRQFIAALIVFYAIKYVGENRPVRYIILVFTASVFHWSALVMTIMYIFLKIKPGYAYLAVAAAGTILFCIFSRTAMFWFIENFPMYSGYNPDKNIEASGGLPIWYTLMFGSVYAVAFIFRKKLIEKNPNNSIYINCLMFTVIFEAMGTRHGILSRFALLTYLPAVLYLIPDIVVVVKETIEQKFAESGKSTAVKSAAAGVSSVAAIACYTILLLNNYNGVVPYVSIFNKPHEVFQETAIEEDDSDESFKEEWYTDDSEEFFEDEEWVENDGDTENSADSESFEEDDEWEDEDWEYDQELVDEMNDALLDQLG